MPISKAATLYWRKETDGGCQRWHTALQAPYCSYLRFREISQNETIVKQTGRWTRRKLSNTDALERLALPLADGNHATLLRDSIWDGRRERWKLEPGERACVQCHKSLAVSRDAASIVSQQSYHTTFLFTNVQSSRKSSHSQVNEMENEEDELSKWLFTAHQNTHPFPVHGCSFSFNSKPGKSTTEVVRKQ